MRVSGEIGKLLGAKWKELDESEKKVCVVKRYLGSILLIDIVFLAIS